MTRDRSRGQKPRSSPPTTARPSGRARVGVALALGLVAFLLYANTIGHGYVLDDDIVTRKNSLVQQGTAGLRAIFTHSYLYGFNGVNDSYRPVVLASLAVDVQAFGNNPRAHHAVNVALFALSVALLYLFLARLFDGARPAPGSPGGRRLVPIFATLLFAAHPIHTEVVANIKSRDELLAFFFGISSLRLLLSYVDSHKIPALGASLACYLLATLSKETGLAVLGLVPLTLWFFRTSAWRRIALVTLPFIAIAALSLLLRHNFTSGAPFDTTRDVINNVLLTAPTAAIWLASRIAVLGRYLYLLFVPYPLSYDYSYNQVPLVGLLDGRFLLSLAVHIALLAVAVWGFARKHVISYAIWIYAVLLFPVSNLAVPLGTVMAERLIFAASAGFCLALAWLVLAAADRSRSSGGAYAGVALIVLFYSGLTIARNQDWKDQGALFASGLRTAPRSARVQEHYGSFLRERAEAMPPGGALRARDLNDALPYYTRAIEILPAYEDAHYNKGVTWLGLGNLDSAKVSFQRALAIDSLSRRALNNLGVVHYRRREYEEARIPWLTLARVDPRSAMAFFSIGASYLEQGSARANRGESSAATDDFRQAAVWFERAYALDPTWPGVGEALARTYGSLGDDARAAEWKGRLGAGVPQAR